MFPSEFLRCYHAMLVVDPLQSIYCIVSLKRYISGMPSDGRAEYAATLGAVASKCLGLKSASSVPTWFRVPHSSKIAPTEDFSRPGMRRAYGGRASPEEVRDTLRLAHLVGRCKSLGPKAYAEKWFGLDCNAFVGNYQGISPSSSVESYVAGYGTQEKIKGATEDVYLTRSLLPLPPVKDVAGIGPGTVIVTYGAANSWGSHWRHIALVESFVPNATGTGGKISIVEWGLPGGWDKHTDYDRAIELRHEDFSWKVKRFTGKRLYAFWNDKLKTELRVFLDASAWSHIACRGWHIGEKWET